MPLVSVAAANVQQAAIDEQDSQDPLHRRHDARLASRTLYQEPHDRLTDKGPDTDNYVKRIFSVQ